MYLFGRTAMGGEIPWTDCGGGVADHCLAGEYALFDKTISRKHLTIQIDEVPEGGGVRAICMPDTYQRN
jgi:hypothetical protein